MVVRTLYKFQVSFLNFLGDLISGNESGEKYEIRYTGGASDPCNFRRVSSDPYPQLLSADSPILVKKEIVRELKKLQGEGWISDNFKGKIKFDFQKKVKKNINSHFTQNLERYGRRNYPWPRDWRRKEQNIQNGI